MSAADLKKMEQEAVIVGTARECGKCALCCKVAIVPELGKPGGEWCSHAKPGAGGCSIYGSDNRPPVCKRFRCAWLSGVVPEALRPDLVHAYISGLTDGPGMAVHVDTQHPDAWRSGPLAEFIARMVKRMRVVVRVGSKEFNVRAGRANGERRIMVSR